MLSELYQEKLVTEEEVKRMKEGGRNLTNQLIPIQCTKPPEVVTTATVTLDKFGHNEEARQLRGW